MATTAYRRAAARGRDRLALPRHSAGYAVLHVATGGLIGIVAFTALTTLVSLTVGLLPTVIGTAVVCAFLWWGSTPARRPCTAPG